MMTWAFDARGLNPVERLILLALADWANDDGECWPGQVSIAEKVEVSESTVRRVLTRLRTLGVLEVSERRRPDGYKTSNLYRLMHTSPVNLTGESSAVNLTYLTGQSDTSHQSTVTGQEPLVEPEGEPSEQQQRGRATDKQIEFIRDLYINRGGWVSAEKEAEWLALSIAQADSLINEYKAEPPWRRRQTGGF